MEAIISYWQPVLAAVVFMAMDMLTGFAGALKMNEVISAKMREGLWHKAGFIGLIVLSIIYEVAAEVFNKAVALSGNGVEAVIPELPAVGTICLIVAAIEVVSICENLCVLNPRIARLPFIDRLKAHNPAAPDFTVGIEDDELDAESV